MGEFRMPSLGADMDVGTIVEWLVKPGDAVRRGQIVAVVDTAKAAIEIEAFEEGVITEILVGTGVRVPVGTPLAMIGATAAPATAAAMTAPPLGTPPPLVVDSGGSKVGLDYQPSAEHPRATPPVRHLARQLGLDVDAIPGTGPDGHITHDDVLRAAPATSTAAAPTARAEPPDRGSIDAGAGAGEPRVRDTAQPPARGTGARLRVTPRARRIAAERGIDLADLAALAASGSPGAGSAAPVVGVDVERAADAAPVIRSGSVASSVGNLNGSLGGAGGGPVEAAGGPGVPGAAIRGPGAPGGPALRGAASAERKEAMRTAIANLMSRSNAEIPHYYVTQTMDLAAALAWLRTHNATLPVARRVLPAALFLRATVLAATAVPDLNGHWIDGTLRPAQRVDLGVAVATRGGGLVTPAITDAGPMRIDALMAALSDLVGRARRGNLRQAEMAGASITVSSLGETGPDALYGVIFPPQVALVGVGGILERPWAVEGMLTVRPTVTVTLAADHRASDGRTASAFLATFTHALQNPEEL